MPETFRRNFCGVPSICPDRLSHTVVDTDQGDSHSGGRPHIMKHHIKKLRKIPWTTIPVSATAIRLTTAPTLLPKPRLASFLGNRSPHVTAALRPSDLLPPASALADGPYCRGHAVRWLTLPDLRSDRFVPMIWSDLCCLPQIFARFRYGSVAPATWFLQPFSWTPAYIVCLVLLLA